MSTTIFGIGGTGPTGDPENCVALIAAVPKGALIDEPELSITDATSTA